MNHARVILGKSIRIWLTRVTRHIGKEITPVDAFPTLVQKDERFGRARRGQSGSLEEDAIRRGQTTIGAGESAEVKVHRYAAGAGLGRAVHGNVARVRGTPIDGGVPTRIWPERTEDDIYVCIPIRAARTEVQVGPSPGVLVQGI